ncbi:hypothetical protein diail_10072 [Diaporthe ilicicola]|nr:hypothetical protein diail_10072 [Diaporthe ilicicola]
MPPKRKCPHENLTADVSPHADETGFQQLDCKRRYAATIPSGRAPPTDRTSSKPSGNDAPGGQDASTLASLFPAPLILPGDDLALDPAYPPQSLASWLRGTHRNKFTSDRKTLYVAEVPAVSKTVQMVSRWAQHNLVGKNATMKGKADGLDGLKPPNLDDIEEYLGAFYHGIPVKKFSQTLDFMAWESEDKRRAKKKTASSFIGLRCGSSCTRIRTRRCPDGTFPQQLNLNDILDAAIAALPDDAYALLFVVNHDLYEDDDDDFCCGRAYGGSRVAVVSSARYNPALLLQGGIDLDHAWPASHCQSYVSKLCGLTPGPPRGRKRRLGQDEDVLAASPLHNAVVACAGVAAQSLDPGSLRGLWLCLLARTASHELGHCLGIGHCTYYACVMQGTAGLAEDCRQPPYLCLVCLKKLTHAAREANVLSDFDETGYVIDNYQAMAVFCEKWKQVGMAAGYKGWLDDMTSRLRDVSFRL